MEFDVNKRFLGFIEKKNYKQSDIYKTIGAKQPQVNNWIQYKEQIPNSRIVDIIKKYPEINANWLIRGEKPMLSTVIPIQQTICDNNDGIENTTANCPDCIWHNRLIAEKEKTIAVLEQLVAELRRRLLIIGTSHINDDRLLN